MAYAKGRAKLQGLNEPQRASLAPRGLIALGSHVRHLEGMAPGNENRASSLTILLCWPLSLFSTTQKTWEEIERSFFKKALSMCQDVDHHIRIATCGQLSSIARIAGRDLAAKTILPELFELLNDEEIQV